MEATFDAFFSSQDPCVEEAAETLEFMGRMIGSTIICLLSTNPDITLAEAHALTINEARKALVKQSQLGNRSEKLIWGIAALDLLSAPCRKRKIWVVIN